MTPTPNYAQLFDLLLPEIVLILTALVVMAADLLVLRKLAPRARFTAASLLASLGCIFAILQIAAAPAAVLFSGALISNPLVHLVQIFIVLITIAVLLLFADSHFTEHVGEFVLLILAATIGGMLLAATQDLLVIFLSIELLSLSLYILAAFDKSVTRGSRASEAALKYFLFGGMSAGFLLFGFSLLYGLANSTSLPVIAAAIDAMPGPRLNPLVAIAIVTTAIGLGFKIAAAPLHFWAPDVYQGAPAPSAALIASGSKVASFFLFFQIAALSLLPAAGSAALRHPARGWVPVLAILAVASMLLGNLAALRQSSLRRLLAYSAVAHAGTMLIAIAAHTAASLSALLYYVFTYALATIGVFAVISVVEEDAGPDSAQPDSLASLAGLSRRSPLLAASLAIFILSLAGIPPLAGFFGKFYLFVAALQSVPGSTPLLWLVVLAIAMSAVSLYYYLQVLKRTFVTPAESTTPLRAPNLTQLLVLVLAAAVVLLGCLPHLLLNWIDAAIAASGL